jgi:hypothetical protein
MDGGILVARLLIQRRHDKKTSEYIKKLVNISDLIKCESILEREGGGIKPIVLCNILTDTRKKEKHFTVAVVRV